jgi:hypothetical protein
MINKLRRSSRVGWREVFDFSLAEFKKITIVYINVKTTKMKRETAKGKLISTPIKMPSAKKSR